MKNGNSCGVQMVEGRDRNNNAINYRRGNSDWIKAEQKNRRHFGAERWAESSRWDGSMVECYSSVGQQHRVGW